MYDEYHLNDGTPSYLSTTDTLDQDAALAMTPAEFDAEMRRLRDRARRRRRKPAHRRALRLALHAWPRAYMVPTRRTWQS
jgi:hypothetical protein